MTQSSVNLEHYLREMINDPSLDNQIAPIVERFRFKDLLKNDCFVEQGEVCKYFCFIQSGILQHSIDVLGEEKTTYLALKNSVTSALKSFKNRVPSQKQIKAISDSSLWLLTLPDFKYLLKQNRAFDRFYFNLIERQIYLIDDRRIELLTLTPEERYLKLLSNEPTLLQKVPLRYLSSYLGISVRHMSRIRKKTI